MRTGADMEKTVMIAAGLILLLMPRGTVRSDAPLPDRSTGNDAPVEFIAFQSNRGGSLDIHLMSADGTGLRRLTTDPADDISPAISPDGSMIAFVSNRDGEDRIYLMNSDGGDLRRLTRTAGAEDQPAWFPDGERIIFRKALDGGRMAICAIRADGSGFRPITGGTVRYFAPVISPDGTKILCNATGNG